VQRISLGRSDEQAIRIRWVGRDEWFDQCATRLTDRHSRLDLDIFRPRRRRAKPGENEARG
jgi:hypothetical protein